MTVTDLTLQDDFDEDDLAVPDLMPTAMYVIADRRRGDPTYNSGLLPKCPNCGRRYVPLTEPAGAMSTSHGVVDGTPVCTGAPLPAPKPVPRRTSRAAAELRRKSEDDQVLAAAQLIYEAALKNRVNFTAAVWRISMDRAGVSEPIRRRAVVHAIRQGWIETVHVDADQQNRKTRWQSLVYVALRRTRPTTNS